MYRTSVFWFAGLFLLAIGAFWPTYFFPKKYETDWHVHLHGVAMFLWVLLMIAQAWLVRAKVFAAHRALGKVVARLPYFTAGSIPPLMQVATYALVDVILLMLIRADWKAHRPVRVYPAMLALFVATQLPTFLVPGLPSWRAFAEAFAALPLP